MKKMTTAGTLSGERGMSLVEVLVSLTILMVVGLGVSQLMIRSMQINQLSQQRSMATGLAAERIQTLTSMRFQSSANYLNYKLPEETAAAGPPATLTADYGQIPDYPQYRRVTTLTYNTPVIGMLRVQCVVSWRNVVQGVKSHEMVIYIDSQLTQ